MGAAIAPLLETRQSSFPFDGSDLAPCEPLTTWPLPTSNSKSVGGVNWVSCIGLPDQPSLGCSGGLLASYNACRVSASQLHRTHSIGNLASGKTKEPT